MRTFDDFTENEKLALEESFRAGDMANYNKLFFEFVNRDSNWELVVSQGIEVFGHFYESIDDESAESWSFLNNFEDELFEDQYGNLFKHFQPGKFVPVQNTYEYISQLLELHNAKESQDDRKEFTVRIPKP